MIFQVGLIRGIDDVIFFVELQTTLREFFQERCQVAADEWTQSMIEPFLQSQDEIQPILDQWFKLIQECKPYTQHQDRPSDEDIFSNAFQIVLHTGTNYEILLQLEYSFQSEIEEIVRQRDRLIQELDSKFVHFLFWID